MRKLVILVIALSISIVAFGQRTAHVATEVSTVNDCRFPFAQSHPFSRTTALGDTFVISNISAADTPLVAYYATGSRDSGYITGMDVFNDIGFAESYNIGGEDSSVVIIGVVALFHGSISPLSTQTITFNAWDETPFVVRPTFEYSGLPNDNLDSLVVNATQLGIGTTVDTLKTFLFPNFSDTVGAGTDINYVGSSFFVGYTVNYNFGLLNGDTLGIASSSNGSRSGANTYSIGTYFDVDSATGSIITVIDTVVNVQNATQESDYTWHDNYTDNDSLLNDLAIYPIIVVAAGPTGITNVSRNGLTFFGNYPNPASDETNIKFSLLQSADVTIQIMDMKGSLITTINNAALSSGEHVIPVNTSAMPSGNYLYFVHTSTGSGIASKMTVVRN